MGLSLAVIALATTPALAQSSADAPVSTATGANAPTSAPPPAPLRIDVARDDEDQPQGPVRDGKIHGMVEAGVGTNGYRQGAAAIDAPLPDGGDIAIAVESDQMQGGRTRKADHLTGLAN
jgi:hypothetical protein